jgi:hypothetical protein
MMIRARLLLIAAGVLIGYLAKDPSPMALIAIAALSGPTLWLLRLWGRPTVAFEDGPREVDHLAYELTRARRFGRELSLVVVQPTARELLPPAVRRSVIEGLAIRGIDRGWTEGDRLFLLLPETNQGGADLVIRRIEAGFDPGSVRTASAVFPLDAVTSGGLVKAALSGLADAERVRPMRAADSRS